MLSKTNFRSLICHFLISPSVAAESFDFITLSYTRIELKAPSTRKKGEEQKNDENLFRKIILRDFPHVSMEKFLFPAFIAQQERNGNSFSFQANY